MLRTGELRTHSTETTINQVCLLVGWDGTTAIKDADPPKPGSLGWTDHRGPTAQEPILDKQFCCAGHSTRRDAAGGSRLSSSQRLSMLDYELLLAGALSTAVGIARIETAMYRRRGVVVGGMERGRRGELPGSLGRLARFLSLAG